MMPKDIRDLKKLGVVWGEILRHREISLEALKEAVANRDPASSKVVDDVIKELYALGLIDYEGDKIVVSDIIPDDILEMPCIHCDKLPTCRLGARNDPFKCEKFVEWFINRFSEHLL